MPVNVYTSLAVVKAREGITDTTDDSFLSLTIGEVSEWMENKMGRSVGPEVGVLYTFDGFSSVHGMYIPVQRGIRAITLLQIAQRTGATLVTVPSSDYFIKPYAQDRRPGWPGFGVQLTNVPVSTNPATFFYDGFANVAITGDYNWAVLPLELQRIATSLVITAYRGRSSSAAGESFTIGLDGSRTFDNMLGSEDRKTLARYTTDRIAVG